MGGDSERVGRMEETLYESPSGNQVDGLSLVWWDMKTLRDHGRRLRKR